MNSYFKNKKITVMGLGLLGRGLGDVRYLAKNGAELIVTDLKTRKDLRESLAKLRGLRGVQYVLGKHRLGDFCGRDFILKAAGVALDSPYIAEARKRGIPVEMDESLFMQLAPPIVSIGITGTRGKTTATHLLYEILKAPESPIVYTGRRTYLGGNVRGMATLPLLDDVRAGDAVVLELSSWQLQGLGDARISPNIAVVTNFMDDHLNYYHGDRDAYWRDKTQIFLHQKAGDVVVATPEVARRIRALRPKIKSRLIVARPSDVPRTWKVRLAGEHNRANLACALRAAQALDVPRSIVKKVAESFAGVEGRLERIRVHNGIEVYNDTTATTPDATLAGLEALAQKRNVILIMGGADKGLDMKKLLAALPRYTKAVILLTGSGTRRIRKAVHALGHPIRDASTLGEAVRDAVSAAKAGDRILFSPAFASFGEFRNEFDRGEQFTALIKKLK
ncbi:MAG: UDP-N-acetylmuramoyl-L-alanine--D-glutamate ligase [Candidatus Niyogibacteria bacterium]|nr:UDP-N-acetylmuramoyl-L-alanine--D-glutamate ligase [Candidatus Niyogibacteria bacterium]